MASGRASDCPLEGTTQEDERFSSVWAVERPASPGEAVFALHDAKNMLGVLQANIDYVTSELTSASPPVADALSDLRESAERLGELLREALEALRGPSERTRAPSAVRVLPVVTAAASRFRRRAEAAGVRVELRAKEDPRALIPPDLLARVLDNLLDNALRHSKPGDTVEVSCTSHDGRALVAVADEGPGVPEEAQEAIFTAYLANGHPEGGHFGLGLAFCRSVARAYSGNVHVENRRGGGACFVLEVS
jgi:signal transduction histidine kinase